jgi:hypothetical protein
MALNEPVPSKAFDVLEENMRNNDKFVNSTDLSFTNRPAPNGQVTTKTLAGMNKDFDDQSSEFQDDIDQFNIDGDAAIDNINNIANNLIYSTGFQNVGAWMIGATVDSAQETLTFDGEEYNTTAGPFTVTVDGATPSADSEDWFNVTLQDRKTVARGFNFLDSEVGYLSDLSTSYTSLRAIYDSTLQRALIPKAKDGSQVALSGQLSAIDLTMNPLPQAIIGTTPVWLLLSGEGGVAYLDDYFIDIRCAYPDEILDGNQWREVMKVITPLIQDNMTLDLNYRIIDFIHDGINTDAPTRDGENVDNGTSYVQFEKKNNITLKNARLSCDLDMTNDSLRMVTFYGCKDVVFDNVELNLSCSGFPVYLVNLLETNAILIDFRHHLDMTIGKGLEIKSNCKFRVFHPDGYSIGDGTGNPVHPTYAGKLTGIAFYGDFDAVTPLWMDDLLIEDGVEFFDSTARSVWCWTYRDVIIGDMIFRDCGRSPTAEMYFGIRMIHGGRNVSVGNLSFIDCWMFSGVYFTSNGSAWHPINVSIGVTKFVNCIGNNSLFLVDGKNIHAEPVQMDNSPLEEGVLITTVSTNDRTNNVVIEGITATGTLGRLFSILGDIYGKISINGLYSKEDTGQDMTGIYGGYIENYTSLNGSRLSINNVHVVGYQNGLFFDAACTVPLYMNDFIINNCLGNGITFTTLSGEKSRFNNGSLSGNVGHGMRLPRNSKAYNIEGENNVGLLVQMSTDSILDGFTVDDGSQSADSGIGIVTGETGWIIKNGTIKSTAGNFTYGIDAPQVGHILRNDFIGTVGTTAKWNTFGGTNVQFNTPDDNP